MSSFHHQLSTVQIALWRDGSDATPELVEDLKALEQAALPTGIVRLSVSKLAPGPHLEAQRSGVSDGPNIVQFARPNLESACAPSLVPAPRRV